MLYLHMAHILLCGIVEAIGMLRATPFLSVEVILMRDPVTPTVEQLIP
jgi:hypothetical protein